jgi:hypothetical protein
MITPWEWIYPQSRGGSADEEFQILQILKESEGGMPVAGLCRKHSMSDDCKIAGIGAMQLKSEYVRKV